MKRKSKVKLLQFVHYCLCVGPGSYVVSLSSVNKFSNWYKKQANKSFTKSGKIQE